MRLLPIPIQLALGMDIAASFGCGGVEAPRTWSLNVPPDNIQVGGGVWGLDFDEDQSVVLSGTRSIHFLATGTAEDPYFENIDPVEVVEGAAYTGEVTWRAASVAADATMRAEIRWLDATYADVSQSTIYDGVLGATNTWETRRATYNAPSGARFARERISRNNVPFEAWVDGFDIAHAPPHAHLRRITNQAITSGLSTKVTYDSLTECDSIDYSLSGGTVTIREDGLYHIHSYIDWAPIATGSRVITNILIGALGTYIAAIEYNWSGGDLELFPSALGILRLAAGDSLSAWVTHDHGTPLDIQAARFIVTRIE